MTSKPADRPFLHRPFCLFPALSALHVPCSAFLFRFVSPSRLLLAAIADLRNAKDQSAFASPWASPSCPLPRCCDTGFASWLTRVCLPLLGKADSQQPQRRRLRKQGVLLKHLERILAAANMRRRGISGRVGRHRCRHGALLHAGHGCTSPNLEGGGILHRPRRHGQQHGVEPLRLLPAHRQLGQLCETLVGRSPPLGDRTFLFGFFTAPLPSCCSPAPSWPLDELAAFTRPPWFVGQC